MKVSIELSPEYSEPYAIIYADKITDNIQRTLDIFGSKYIYGKNDLFSVVITFRYLLPKTDFLLFKKQLWHIFDRYQKQNLNLKLNDLFEYMGFPCNWKEITKFRKI